MVTVMTYFVNLFQEFIRKCVDFDVKHSKVVKILKNEQDLQDIRYIL